MKAYIKNTLLLILPLLLIGSILSGCQKDDMMNGGEPVIHYIRVTDPAASDSLLVESSLSRLIAIVGENLQDTREIWFNDREAVLNPTFITNRTILVNVPNLPPNEVTNKMVLKFANGRELAHDFVIRISPPQVDRIKNEHVPDGGELVLQGEFFFEPIKVTFAGGKEANVVEVTQNQVRVTVPEGAESGPVTVQTNFGRATTKQWFRDTRNVFSHFENTDFTGWWHGPNFVKAEAAGITPITGKFLHINQSLDMGQWFEYMVANTPSTMPTQNIPDDAIRNPSNYNLKFEINTQKPILAGTRFRFYIGNDMPGERNNKNYTWTPVLDTKGEWETVTIPFELLIGASGARVSASGYGVSFWIWDSTIAADVNFAMDNFRVTPK